MAAEKKAIRLCARDELDLEKTFECGQCFRWNADETGAYTGVAFGRAARIWAEDGFIFIDAPEADKALWHNYFDLDMDYAKASERFCCGEYMEKCLEFGYGIRLLRQDRWEALCSFILSQCNNIPRIKKIIETLCRLFGDPIAYGDKTYYSFPDAETVARLGEDDLAPLKCGYRAPYLLAAASAVADGSLSFSELDDMNYTEALKAVQIIRGVGEKVANCFILFGMHNLAAFPVDVWMKRALDAHFPKAFDPETFGEYAGLAQQYIFYYARSGENP